jgi:TatD DNase family protein
MSDQEPELAVKAGAVDSHCHLFLLEEQPPRVVEAARAAGVDTLICAGIDPETSRRSAELAASLDGVFATAGMHPHTASDLDSKSQAEIEQLLASPLVVGVGECGLDFYRMRSPREDQERVFRFHILLSRESGAPLVVHVREAWPEILRLLDEGSAEHVVLHCFSGTVDVARECAARGYFLSFAGNLTYPKNQHLRDAAATVPWGLVLVETDSPFLPPQRLRGRENHPANVLSVVEEIARLRGESFSSVLKTTRANARVAFPRLP